MNTSENQARFPSQLLCAADLEGRAGNAVIAAVWLSERLRTPLELVHAFPPRPTLCGREVDMPEWMAGRESAGRSLRHSLGAIVTQAPAELGLRAGADGVRFHISSGHRVQVILERARAIHADVIVMGSHHDPGSLDFGDTMRGVLAHGPRGVWMQPIVPRAVRRILVPVDLSDDSLAALATARDLAHSFGAGLTVLQAFEPPALGQRVSDGEPGTPTPVLDRLRNEDRAQFEYTLRSFDWRGVPHEARFEQGDPARHVLASQDGHDLVIMGTHGRTGLSAVLLGSVVHKVLRSARIPVLALRHPRSSYLI